MPMTNSMNSIVVHYKELALKGRTARGSSSSSSAICVLRSGISTSSRPGADGPDRNRARRGVEPRLGRGAAGAGRGARSDRRIFGIANFSHAGRAPHDFEALAAAILADLGDHAGAVVSGQRPAGRQAAAVHVTADRARGRRAHQGSQGLARRSRRSGADDSPRDAARRTRSISSARSRAPAVCRPVPAAASPVCSRAGSTRRSRPTG